MGHTSPRLVSRITPLDMEKELGGESENLVTRKFQSHGFCHLISTHHLRMEPQDELVQDLIRNTVENPFPAPPERYKLFTKSNLECLKFLRERTSTTIHDLLPDGQTQPEILSDQPAGRVPVFDLLQLEPPR